jgi:RNA polymerase sigma-70 factor (ECF subfamily)
LSLQVVSAQRLWPGRHFDNAQGRPERVEARVSTTPSESSASGMTDTARFEAFVREYEDMVYATAVRLLSNPAEAEDVAQTVFLKAFERFDDLASSPTVAGWLKTVTTNLCLNHLSRYRSRWRLFSELGSGQGDAAGQGDHVDELMSRAGVASGAMTDSAVEAAGEHERLERALRELPDHQRVPIVLFHFEDKSYLEIAALLGVSLAKVKTDIHRGREALKSVLISTHA